MTEKEFFRTIPPSWITSILLMVFNNKEVFREAVTTVKWLMGVICSANVCTVEPEAIIIESFSSINLAAAVAILFFSSFRSFSFSCTLISDVNGLTGLALP